MENPPIPFELRNYFQLLERVNAHASGVESRFASRMRCAPGCDGCCLHISVFPVEAAAIRFTLGKLPRPELERLVRACEGADDSPRCPLLRDGLCGIYQARPLICRTHGLPLLVEDEEGRRVDFCPLNFNGLNHLPSDAVLSLATLNQTLAAVNALYVKQTQAPEAPERILLARVLREFAATQER